MADDVQRRRPSWRSGLLLFLVVAVVYGVLTAARGASLTAAVVGALVFAAIFVPLFSWLVTRRGEKRRGQRDRGGPGSVS